jgi:hypothetical protein
VDVAVAGDGAEVLPVGFVVRRTGQAQRRLWAQALDQVMDSLVGDQAPGVEGPALALDRQRTEAPGVDATVDDDRPVCKVGEVAGVEVADQEQTGGPGERAQAAVEVAVAAGVIGEEDRLPQEAGDQDTLVGEEGVQLVTVHDVGAGDFPDEGRRHRAEPLGAEVAEGAIDAQREPVDAPVRWWAEGHQACLGQLGHRPGQLERVALTPADDAPLAEQLGRDVQNLHQVAGRMAASGAGVAAPPEPRQNHGVARMLA